jgi:DNA invertase Pin-like site-specific DNA recombinase
MGLLVGYARVSSVGQSLDVQLDKLNAHGVAPENIYREKVSGTRSDRQQLQQCLRALDTGDVLVVTKLDRLARSTLDLHKILHTLNEKGVGFRVLDQAVDTTTPMGRLVFGILASIAEFETQLRKERQLEGIAKAQQKGVKFGRSSKLTSAAVQEIPLCQSS